MRGPTTPRLAFLVLVSAIPSVASAQAEPDRPDLDLWVLHRGRLPQRVAHTQPIAIGFEVMSNLNQTVPLTEVVVLVSDDGGAVVRANTVGLAASRDDHIREISYFPPGTLVPGLYDISVTVDPRNRIAESDETNNTDRVGRVEVHGGALEIQPERLPAATVGQVYQAQLRASPAPAAAFALSGRGLPAGLSVARDGRVSGVATSIGDYCFSVIAEAPHYYGDQAQVCLQVVDEAASPLALRVTLPDQIETERGVAATIELTADNGVEPYTWIVTTGAIPDGLYVDGQAIVGVPTTDGTFIATVEVSDAVGDRAQQSVAFVVRSAMTARPPSPELPTVEPGCGCRATSPREGGLMGAFLLGLVLIGGRRR